MPERQSLPQIVQVKRLPGTLHGGLIMVGALLFRCQLGATGVTWMKREGDRATPAARMRLVSLSYRADRIARPPGLWGARARALASDDGWSDDDSDGCYNRPVKLPFPGSHEGLWREDHVYDVVGVLDWNLWPRSLGRGSAIFLHLARPDHGPTAGCIALDPADMRRFLRILRPEAEFRVG